MKKLLLAAAGSLLWLGASAQTWVNYDKLLFVIDDTDNTAQLAAPYRCPLANYDESGYWDNVVVPVQIENGGKTYTVTSVMNEAFYLRQPTSISFPETIKTIGDEVFYGVSTLKSVVFPNSVETIGSLGHDGVEGVAADSDAPVRYFNLQGIEVSRPERGIYIRIEGDRATRVYIAR